MALAMALHAQSISLKYEKMLTNPQGYVAYRTAGNIKVDGKLDEVSWKNAPYTTSFVGIKDGETPKQETRAKMLWDDTYLYIGVELEESDVQARLSQRDTIVFYDNALEVLIDPDGDGQNYFEIETNAKGTIFDLFVQQPYRTPQPSFATFEWDAKGMLLKTNVKGTLNKSRDKDQGWTVEMAIPRQSIAREFDNYLQAGNYLRLGMARVQWENGKDSYTTWGAFGKAAIHMPERWGFVYLSDKKVGSATEEFQYPTNYNLERLLWAMFYEQASHFSETGSYYTRTEQLKLHTYEVENLPKETRIKVEGTSRSYVIVATMADGNQTSINENGLLLRTK